MTYADELEFSNALYSKSNWGILKQILEDKVGYKLENFKVISREFPVAKAKEFRETNEKKIGFIDLVAVGFANGFAHLFIIEVKRRLSKIAVEQVKSYVKAFWYFMLGNFNFVTLWAGSLSKLGFPDFVEYSKDKRIRLIPVLIYFGGSVIQGMKDEDVIFIKIEERGRLMRKIFENYVRDRYSSLTKKFPELKGFYDKLLARVRTFVDTVIPYYPTLVENGIEIKGIYLYSRERKKRVVREIIDPTKFSFTPATFPMRKEPESSLDVFMELLKGKSGEFVIQVFTNGIDKGRPSIFLQLTDDEYLTLQMSENKVTSWRINGIFNKFVAHDCEPVNEPIFMGSYCLVRGQYRISRYLNTNVLRLEMFADRQLDVDDNGQCIFKEANMRLEAFIVCPKIRHIFRIEKLNELGLSLEILKEYNLLPYVNPLMIQEGIDKLWRSNNSELKRKIFENELILKQIRVLL